MFLGAPVTLGSSGAISNIVAGVVLTYTGAFRVGDFISIGGTTGTFAGKTLLVTRIQTNRNVDVTIPNGTLLSSSVENYSAQARQKGLVPTVSTGIGYDIEWRTVHRLMIEGASQTEHVLADPKPCVWQETLGDYAVVYELRALRNGRNSPHTWAECSRRLQWRGSRDHDSQPLAQRESCQRNSRPA